MVAVLPPVVFLAFANERLGQAGHLRNLAREQRGVREALLIAERAGLCEVVERSNAMLEDIWGVFQDPRYRGRVAVFHFGGHASSASILLNSGFGDLEPAHGAPLARFLGEQRGLELVFLNGCLSADQGRGLIKAGIPVSIVTSQAVDDRVAARFAARFYTGLASGISLKSAYSETAEAQRAYLDERPAKAYNPDWFDSKQPQEHWPWELFCALGSERLAETWSLPRIARNPLFGIPKPKEIGLPLSPFKHLHAFTRQDAGIFFGRDKEIRQVFDAVTLPQSEPILLLSGASGAGKSSLLDAGVCPRLEIEYDVFYLKRDRALGLTGTLQNHFSVLDDSTRSEPGNIRAAWWKREQKSHRPLVVILDQVEEAWRHSKSESLEFVALVEQLQQIFGRPDQRPRGRFILGFRKGWLAEIEETLSEARLPFTKIFVDHLDRQGIIDAVSGASGSEVLRQRYGLFIEMGLPAMIADHLGQDPSAAVAPVLQILLARLWSEARIVDAAVPYFSIAAFRRFQQRGLLLEDFVKEQLEDLGASHPVWVGSGLALSLLNDIAKRLDSEEEASLGKVMQHFGERPEILELIELLQDRYLLSVQRPGRGALTSEDDLGHEISARLRIIHFLLVPIVRDMYGLSNLPGQRAERILLHRINDRIECQQESLLDAADLETVDRGLSGMRCLSSREEDLVAASRECLRQEAFRVRRRRRFMQLGILFVLGSTILALTLWRQAELARTYSIALEAEASASARIALTSSLIDRNDAVSANLILFETRRPENSGTLESLLHRAAEQREHLRLEHSKRVTDVAFSRDGQRVVTASDDGSVKVWDAWTGRGIAALEIQGRGRILSASWNSNGTQVVSSSQDGTVIIWDLQTETTRILLEGHPAKRIGAEFSEDGQHIVTFSRDGEVKTWDAITGEEAYSLKLETAVLKATWSPGGTQILITSQERKARLWDPSSDRMTVLGNILAESAAFSRDGAWVIVSSRQPVGAWLWSVQESRFVQKFVAEEDTGGFGSAAMGVSALSPDANWLVTSSIDGTARVWDVKKGDFRPLLGHSSRVAYAEFSADSTQVLTFDREAGFSKNYKKANSARVWDVKTGALMATYSGHQDEITAAAFAPGGDRVVTASKDKTARVWIASDNPAALVSLVQNDHAPVRMVSFSPDGRRIVTVSRGSSALLWDAATGRRIASLPEPDSYTEIERSSYTWIGFFSPDGSRILTSTQSGIARLWRGSTGELLNTLEAELKLNRRTAAAFSQDGKRILTATMDGMTRVWETETGRVIWEKRDAVVGRAVDFSPGGNRVVTAYRDGTALLRDAKNGSEVVSFGDYGVPINSIAFSPDAKSLLTASKDGTTKIWDAGTGEELVRLNGHQSTVYLATFRFDGAHVLTASMDSTARIWDAKTGRELRVLGGHSDQVQYASFSPDGKRIVTASLDGTARIWDASTGGSIAVLEGPPFGFNMAVYSPDGSMIVTASRKQATIWAGSSELLLALLRSRNARCLDAPSREKLLGESSASSVLANWACEACVVFFFDQIQAARADGEHQDMIRAWADYETCLEEKKHG